jgi:ubiquinone/menaquinone biosynthesis C-methylase UbiE
MARISRKTDVTYESFGINPAEFYKDKFSCGTDFNPAAVTPSFELKLTWEKYTILEKTVGQLVEGRTEPLRVLDFGCGSGTFGKWLLHRFPDQLSIAGIDMSEACAADAKASGYDDALSADFLSGIPFPDKSFDFIWSMDVFGHIEFRHKDAVIADLARITRPGGTQLHGIETADIPYLICDPNDPNDYIRKYVYMDGHIGAETLDDVYQRFAASFEILEAYPWLVCPFIDAGNAIVNCPWPGYEEALCEFDTPGARQLADTMSHRYNVFLREALRASLGPIQTDERIAALIPDGPARAFIMEIYQGGGFSFVLVRRRPSST